MTMTSASITDRMLLELLGKDRRMIVHSHTPINIETPLDALADVLTPNERFFMRTNHALPAIAASTWTLAIDGHVERPYTLTYADLRRLPSVTLVAFLECYGNGRSRFAAMGQPAEGIPWRHGAIGNAEWTGVPVALLLEAAGLKPGAVQVECCGGGEHGFARGVGVVKLMEDAILAYRMNGQPLPPEHGGPVRLVVPGWGGINWVKWIMGMRVLDHESASEYNQKSYVLLDREGRERGKARAMPVKSAITNPLPHASLSAGVHMVQGLAWSPNGVARVDVSADGGQTWRPARLLDDLGRWSWRPFVWRWEAGAGDYLLASRATDLDGNIQPAAVAFNQKGYLMNAIDMVPVQVG